MDEIRTWKRALVVPGRHLAADLENALRYLFCTFEGDCGVRSVQGRIEDVLVSGTAVQHGSRLGAVDARGNPLLLSAEAWADGEHERAASLRRGDTRRAQKAIGALSTTRAGRDAVTVLYRLFGPRDPSAPTTTFGLVLAPLACLTGTARRLADERARELRCAVDVKLNLFSIIAATKETAPRDRELLLARIKSEATLLAAASCAAYERAYREVNP